MALNDMEHEYETAYIKAALIRSHHLEPHISFSVFLRAICTFSDREYKYDTAQRVDSFIYHEQKRFKTSKSSKWQRGRRIVSYLTETFDEIQQSIVRGPGSNHFRVLRRGGRDNTPPINHIHDFKSAKSIKILIILQIKTIICRENEDISLILWH